MGDEPEPGPETVSRQGHTLANQRSGGPGVVKHSFPEAPTGLSHLPVLTRRPLTGLPRCSGPASAPRRGTKTVGPNFRPTLQLEVSLPPRGCAHLPTRCVPACHPPKTCVPAHPRGCAHSRAPACLLLSKHRKPRPEQRASVCPQQGRATQSARARLAPALMQEAPGRRTGCLLGSGLQTRAPPRPIRAPSLLQLPTR